MKKIIKRKMYNTETAGLIDYATNAKYYGDCFYADERLYRKRNGEYFLTCSNGGLPPYNNDQEPKAAVEVLTIDEAKNWIERHCDANIYEAIFGKVDE